jgi:large subunit ribosomal protein L22
MEVRAISKSVRVSPRKMRLVADAVSNLPIAQALRVLEVTQQKAAISFTKTLNSAIANATNNAKLDRENLYIGTVMVNPGQVLKRFRPSTRGRIHPYKKRGSHLTIILKEKATSNAVVSKVKKIATSDVSKVKKEDIKVETKGGKK